MKKRMGTRLAVAGALALGLAALCLSSAALADISGPVSASSAQDGDNEVDGGQGATISGGDASAGSNIVGTAGRGDASITVENNSVGAEARSGDLESSNSISDVHVGELAEDSPVTDAVEDSPVSDAVEVSADPIFGPIGPLGPLGPEDVTSAEEAPANGQAGAANEDPVDPSAQAGIQPAADPAVGPSDPIGLVLAAEMGPAANERQLLGQVTGPPGPLGPPDLEGTPVVTPSGEIVVPTPAPATPQPTQAPQVVEEQGEGLPVNGANSLKLASFGLALLLLGLVLSASARFARQPA